MNVAAHFQTMRYLHAWCHDANIVSMCLSGGLEIGTLCHHMLENWCEVFILALALKNRPYTVKTMQTDKHIIKISPIFNSIKFSKTSLNRPTMTQTLNDPFREVVSFWSWNIITMILNGCSFGTQIKRSI